MRFPIKRWACGALASAFSAAVMAAAPYPDKPIRLIVPWPAGGSADTIGRALGDALGRRLNATVVVENVAGASGTIATTQFARAAPDGYTLLLASSSANVSAPNLYAKVHFDPINDFAPIGEVALVPSVLIVSENSPFKRPIDIVAAARKQPGKLTYGSGGTGNSGHLSGELFRTINKIEVTHVPYKGNNPALTDLMGGRLDYMFDNGAIGHIQSQRVRALAVAADARLKAIPNVPTFKAGQSIFKSPVGGSGNLTLKDCYFNSGVGSVFNLQDAIATTHAIELNDVNFNNCSSLGVLDRYRQFNGMSCGFYACADGFTIEGNWDGFKMINTNVINFGGSGTFFKKGIASLFNNRFYIDMNLQINTGAKICDFDATNFVNDKSLWVTNCYVKVNGIIDDTTTGSTFPNITTLSSKSYFVDNVGLKNSAISPYGISTGNLQTYADDLAAATGGINIGSTYIETSSGYHKTRLI